MKKAVLLPFVLGAMLAPAQQYTRGLGVYPGDPKQYDGPSLKLDDASYRNLALHRPAYQSSAYDYNLTAQLVTDGIREHELPQWVNVHSNSRSTVAKAERNFVLDGNLATSIRAEGAHPWVQLDVEGGGKVPSIDHMNVWLRAIEAPVPNGWSITVKGSNDGLSWTELGLYRDTAFHGTVLNDLSFSYPVKFAAPANFRSYRFEFMGEGVAAWDLAQVDFFNGSQEVFLGSPKVFSSAWMSDGVGPEWVSVDLGARSHFDHVLLDWLDRPASAALQISDDGKTWTTLKVLGNATQTALDAKASKLDDLKISGDARWVRVFMALPSENGHRYILSELEVWGKGGPVVVPQQAVEAKTGEPLRLSRGAWKVERASQVAADGKQLSTPGYGDASWIPATVPGTVLTSYLNAGAIADPNFADNEFTISDSYFTSEFWYRNEFVAQKSAHTGEHYWLNFDGINWKAEVYLNGALVGQVDGAAERGHFDVTALVKPGEKNALAVRVIPPMHPGGTKDKGGQWMNGGAPGHDAPTYHASVGWDWMSTIRGRETGIWNEVSLTTSGAVRIETPRVASHLPLPATNTADVTISATLHNITAKAVSGKLHAEFGAIAIDEPVKIEANATKVVSLTPEHFKALHIANPKLWWPNGYGEPNLYDVKLSFVANGATSDSTAFKAGIREFAYNEDGNALKMWINGRRFIPHGGNWGFSESMLRYRAREYDVTMRYHREQNMNMVRNWVGSTADDAFFDAADKYGMVVWQDFWLANPWDGPEPDDNNFFLRGAKETILRIRNHASLGVYCGRNEGYPPAVLDAGMRKLIAELAPTEHYIPSSADGVVGGRGPYRVMPVRSYFDASFEKLHSEIGSPNVPEYETMARTIAPLDLWPNATQWRQHDFDLADHFTEAILHNYGSFTTARDFISLAQFVDYDGYRAMFEAQSKNRQGILIWMSHPAWPSVLWQTYDYFYDTNASYYAAKHANEPLHIQWNATTNMVEVVNLSAGDRKKLTAKVEVIDLDGTVKWQKSAEVDSREDSTLAPISVAYPDGLSKTHYIRLSLTEAGKCVSENFYLHGAEEEDYTGIRTLAKAAIHVDAKLEQKGEKWSVVATLRNTSKTPALMVHVKAVRKTTGDVIAPAFYDDNYIALMPGEERTIHGEFSEADTRGEEPVMKLGGFNVAE